MLIKKHNKEVQESRSALLIFMLDSLLDGPDGFTFLNELISYSDTAEIPIIIVSSLDLSKRDLSGYGVKATLCKDTMTPKEVTAAVREALREELDVE